MRVAWIAVLVGACVVPWVDPAGEVVKPSDSDAVVPPGEDQEEQTPSAGIDTSPFGEDDEGSAAPVLADGAVPVDTCAEAISRPPVGAGVYTGSIRGFANSGLRANCISYGTNGPDAFHKITVAEGQTVSVTFDAVGVDSQIYLLRDCNDGRSCVVGADDLTMGRAESITYTNNSGVEQTAYLVLAVFEQTNSADAFDLLIDLQ